MFNVRQLIDFTKQNNVTFKFQGDEDNLQLAKLGVESKDYGNVLLNVVKPVTEMSSVSDEDVVGPYKC